MMREGYRMEHTADVLQTVRIREGKDNLPSDKYGLRTARLPDGQTRGLVVLVIHLPEAEHYFSRDLLISKVSKISERTALSSARIHRDLAKM